MTIANKLEAAVPEGWYLEEPVKIKARTLMDAVRHIADLRDEATGWHQIAKLAEEREAALQLQLSDQRNAKGLAWSLAVIGAGLVGAVVF